MKEIDLTKNVYELTEAYPELIEILKETGFLGVANAIARNTMGRVTTIPQGSKKWVLTWNKWLKNSRKPVLK